jgi:[NiFe] hydrogenase diaphorase moiety small subunit
VKRSGKKKIAFDRDLAAGLSADAAKKAMDQCPVGALLKKEIGFTVPIGKRKFDQKPIGSEFEDKRS